MKLFYITRTSIGSTAAQSIQIEAMSESFNRVLGNNFLLISRGSINKNLFSHKRLSFNSFEILAYLEAAFYAFMYKNDYIYTRDIFIAFVSILFGGRAVYESHKPNKIIGKLFFKIIQKSKRFKLITISKELANFYIKEYQFQTSRLLVLHSGAFPDKYKKATKEDSLINRKKLKIPTDVPLIVHTGTLKKDLPLIFEYILRDTNIKLYILHVGDTQVNCNYWLNYFKERKIFNIKFIPHQPADLVIMYQSISDILFYGITKKTETYWCASPLKLFEYMACEKPIISANYGSIREILNQNNAFLYDIDNLNSLRVAINRCIKNRNNIREIYSSKARKLVLENYNWHKRAIKAINFIKKDF